MAGRYRLSALCLLLILIAELTGTAAIFRQVIILCMSRSTSCSGPVSSTAAYFVQSVEVNNGQ